MKRELTRKAFHIGFGTAFLLLIALLGTLNSFYLIGAFLVLGIIISLIMRKGYTIPLFGKIIASVEREKEKHLPGKAAIFFFISALLLLVLFKDQPIIAMAALSVQVFADSAAALVGKPFGKHKIYKNKSWEGTIACCIVALVCLFFFVSPLIALIGALVATIIEVFPGDDNLWVPIGTGIAIKALFLAGL